LIIHINGWPGSGKLTIARCLAAHLGARLLDNHTLLNPAEALFDRGDPLRGQLRRAIREAVLDHAVQAAADARLIFTDALADDVEDAALFDDYRRLARRRSAALVSIVIDCEASENERRLTQSGRDENFKLTRKEALRDLRARYRLLRPPDVVRLDLDVTALSADQASRDICDGLRGVGLLVS
jgi:thymidylate kinase